MNFFIIAVENHLLKLLKSYLSINAGTIISSLNFLKQNKFEDIYFILQTIKNILPLVIPSLESLVYDEASISMYESWSS